MRTLLLLRELCKLHAPRAHVYTKPLALPGWSEVHLTSLQAMCGAGVAAGPMTAARQIVAAAGWRGLFRGNATNVLRSAPQKALDFFAFDVLKVRQLGLHPMSVGRPSRVPSPGGLLRASLTKM